MVLQAKHLLSPPEEIQTIELQPKDGLTDKQRKLVKGAWAGGRGGWGGRGGGGGQGGVEAGERMAGGPSARLICWGQACVRGC